MKRVPVKAGGGAPLAVAVRRALVAVFIARTAINGGMRVVYPFVPEIARGLGTSLGVVAALVSLRSLAGLTAPLTARAAERYGRRALMLLALAGLLAGCLLIAATPLTRIWGAWGGIAGAAIGFVLIGLAKPAFDVPMQSWFAERVPFARRGRVLGATELTWALSLLVTVPASGALIAATSWQAPFVLVAGLAVCGAAVLRRLVAPDRPAVPQRRPIVLSRPRVALLAAALLFTGAAELVFVVYGAWLEDDFGLSVVAIGVFTVVIVAAELGGEGAVTAFADRLGLRRTVLCGLGVSLVGYTLLPFVGGSLVAAVAAVVVWVAGFETTIVSTVPLVTELAQSSGSTAPEADRLDAANSLSPPPSGADAPPSPSGAPDRLVALLVGVIAGGRAVGALVAPQLYGAGGIGASALTAAGCVLLATLLLRAVPEPTVA